MGRKRRIRREKKTVKPKSQETEPDRVSELPEPVIHHILSFLPAKQVVQTCILSKTWKNVWCSVPVLNFEAINEWFRSSLWRRNAKEFVDKFLLHREKAATVDKFRLKFCLRACSFSDVDNWVSYVLKSNLKELDLSFERDHVMFFTFYCLPETVVLSPSLSVLKLKSCSLDSTASINLPLLKEMHLTRVQLVDRILHELVFNSPSLKLLSLDSCDGLSCVRISSSRLLSLEIIDSYTPRIEVIDVKASSLRCFRYKCVMSKHRSQVFGLASCEDLRLLSLEGPNVTDDEIETLISCFPLLESLILVDCKKLECVKFQSSSLESFVMERCGSVKEAVFSATKLRWFSYSGKPIVVAFTPFVLLEAKLDMNWCHTFDTNWFVQLRRFLVIFDQTEVLTISCSYQALLFPTKLRAIMDSPLNKLKHLKLKLKCLSFIRADELVNSLRWVCSSLQTLSIDNSTGHVLKVQFM